MEPVIREASQDVENGHEGPSIDVVFEDHIGELGRHQIWLFSIVSAAWMPGALMVLNMAFFGVSCCNVARGASECRISFRALVAGEA